MTAISTATAKMVNPISRNHGKTCTGNQMATMAASALLLRLCKFGMHAWTQGQQMTNVCGELIGFFGEHDRVAVIGCQGS